MSDTRIVWSRSLASRTPVHLFTHKDHDPEDRQVDGIRHWLTVCQRIPVRYQMAYGGPIRSAGAELTEDQAVRLGLEFCAECFPEKQTVRQQRTTEIPFDISVRVLDGTVLVRLEDVVGLVRAQETVLTEHGMPLTARVLSHLGDKLRDIWLLVGANSVMPGDLDV